MQIIAHGHIAISEIANIMYFASTHKANNDVPGMNLDRK